MKVMVRHGSAWHDVAEQVRAITELGMESRHFILCTDDSHSETLLSEGHVDRAVKEAIAHGLPPVRAIQMASLNPAEHFGMARDVGQIAPGRYADILLVSDLPQLKINLVIAKGRVAAENGRLLLEPSTVPYPDWATHSVHLAHPLSAEDFRLVVPPEYLPSGEGGDGRVVANVIGVVENQAPTRHLHLRVAIHGEEMRVDIPQDIAKVAVVERHRGTGRVQVGLVHGFGFTVPCAIGTTMAHDCHQMIVVGTSEADMALAANELALIGGGQIVVRECKVVGKVELPIAGLMSNERAELVARKAASVLYGFRACGCMLNNPNMQLSLLALVVIPELRISDLGLVDVTQFKFIPIFEG
jgi:adenine deaminase